MWRGKQSEALGLAPRSDLLSADLRERPVERQSERLRVFWNLPRNSALTATEAIPVMDMAARPLINRHTATIIRQAITAPRSRSIRELTTIIITAATQPPTLIPIAVLAPITTNTIAVIPTAIPKKQGATAPFFSLENSKNLTGTESL